MDTASGFLIEASRPKWSLIANYGAVLASGAGINNMGCGE